MDGDVNDIFQKISSMLSDKETSDNLKNILNNISSSNSTDTSSFSSSDSSRNTSSGNTNNSRNTASSGNTNNSRNTSSNTQKYTNIPNLDINTILKIKSILDTMNNSENDSRSNLLRSLKPYLRDSKKEKIDQYIKLLNMAKVIEVINPLGGDVNKNE